MVFTMAFTPVKKALLTRQSAKIDVLAGVPLFSGLSKKELTEIARNVTEVEYLPQEYLMHEGETGREAFVILGGTVAVRKKGRKVTELSTGAVIGEMSLITDHPRNASVRAETFVNALLMSRREFNSVMDQLPQVAVKILRTVATRLAEAGNS
jgi:CRP/FNR family transcriptional regulator, cyclic AMP receptor protein